NSPAQEYLSNELFKYQGTPSAYLLDEESRVFEPMVLGADDILKVARKAMGAGGLKKLPLTQSHIIRDGLKAGTPAPVFSLPEIHGGTVSLDQFRNRNVLVVFSDPQCGPCDALAPELAQLHKKHANNGLDFVLVGRGDAEQNKKKAVEHGIEFPVV